MSNRYFLDKDNSSHWHLIEENYRDEWNEWKNLDENDESSWNTPDFACMLSGSPASITFTNPIHEK